MSPKQLGSAVAIRVETKAPDQFDNLYEWVQTSGETFSSNKAAVDRGTAARYVLSYKFKITGKVINTMNIWIVWCEINPTLTKGISAPIFDSDELTTRLGVRWDFTANIQPDSICDLQNDVPLLNNTLADLAPNYLNVYAGNPPGLGSVGIIGDATYQWDMTRQWRERALAPTVRAIDIGFIDGSQLAAGIPNPNIILKTSLSMGIDGYPANPLEGNDDSRIDDNPYAKGGIMRDYDTPTHLIAESAAGPLGSTVELRAQFREFVRLDLAGKWYILSNYKYYRLHTTFKKVDESQLKIDLNGNGNMTDILWNLTGVATDSTNVDF